MAKKSKMVSFRISAEEFARLRESCPAFGARNVSELARFAVHRVTKTAALGEVTLDADMRSLRERVEVFFTELDRLLARVDQQSNGDSR